MQANNTPTKIPVPFADSGTKNTIPVPSQIGITAGAASFTTGFPPLTFTPIAAGGVPPFGADFNGVLNAITQALRWTNAGGQYVYDSTFATSIGGYPKGAWLQKATLDGFWMSTADNNTADPDASGAGWVDPLAGRLINIQSFTTVGTSTYTPTVGTKKVHAIVIGGGGGGGGAAAAASSQVAVGGGGGSGCVTEGQFDVAVLSGKVITVGAGSPPTAAGSDNGGSGGASSVGSIITAPGGLGGGGSISVAPPTTQVGGWSSAIGTGGNINASPSNPGGSSISAKVGNSLAGSGSGAIRGGVRGSFSTAGPGSAGIGPGCGGAGAFSSNGTAAQSGGGGADGAVYLYEYS